MSDIWPSPADDERWAAETAALIDAAEPPRKARAYRPKTTFIATDPAGAQHSKLSAATVYTHAVAILPRKGPAVPGFLERWQVLGWVANQEAADRLAEALHRSGDYTQVLTLIATEAL